MQAPQDAVFSKPPDPLIPSATGLDRWGLERIDHCRPPISPRGPSYRPAARSCAHRGFAGECGLDFVDRHRRKRRRNPPRADRSLTNSLRTSLSTSAGSRSSGSPQPPPPATSCRNKSPFLIVIVSLEGSRAGSRSGFR